MDAVKEFPTTECGECGGSGETADERTVSEQTLARFRAEPRSWLKVDESRRVTGPIVCKSCDGIGRQTQAGRAYTSPAMREKARAGRVGRTCYSCDGTGRQWKVPIFSQCHHCRGWGRDIVPVPFPAALKMPEGFELTHSVPGEWMADYYAQVDMVALRRDRPGTWNEANLGLGSIVSVSDYGDAWKANDDDALIRQIRRRADWSVQWCKYVSRETRLLATRLVVLIHRDGYKTVSEASLDQASRLILPPTYTAELLDAPASMPAVPSGDLANFYGAMLRDLATIDPAAARWDGDDCSIVCPCGRRFEPDSSCPSCGNILQAHGLI
jgi:hypothetical protein